MREKRVLWYIYNMKWMSGFWRWYESHLVLNIAVAAFLFSLQLVHLYWLSTDVVLFKLLGAKFFPVNSIWESIIVLVDYTEIPAIITTSLIYIYEYRQKRNFKSLLYLFFLNIQYLHMFWITDEFVVEKFGGVASGLLPAWLAWVAIGIDYLEIPVIIETFIKLVDALKQKNVKKVRRAFEN